MRRLLVLWDVDYTLVDSDGVGRELYQMAFREMFGRPMPQPGSMSGRTDRAIALEVLDLAGVAEPRAGGGTRSTGGWPPTPPAWPIWSGSAAGRCPARPRPWPRWPGPARAATGPPGPDVVQSLLTGNIRPLAEVKLGPLGLTEPPRPGRGRLRRRARGPGRARAAGAAARRRAPTAADFGGAATVLVGDTPLDVAAALATGARAVGVATGQFTAADLAASGAHAVLPDLADTGRVLAAILGPSQP